jgi:hypothetical protein
MKFSMKGITHSDKSMGLIFFVSLFLLLQPGGRPAFANAAAPGFWDAGHGTTMTPLFADEARAISMIQMQKELVLIDLFESHAVVKGTYWLRNHDAAGHRIHVGYPVNGSNRAFPMDHVHFSDLYHLRVFIDGRPQPQYRLSEYPDTAVMKRRVDMPQTMGDATNWYVWDMDFPAGKTVKVEVYFIVPTPASMTRGYGKKEANAFEYVLQTGSAWKDSILNGDIIVNLKSALTPADILGIYPDSSVAHAGDQLLYSFRDLRPGAKDDLIIWYEGSRETALSKLDPEAFYKSIDRTDLSILERTDLLIPDKSDFSTPVSAITYTFIIALLLGLSFLILMIYGAFRLVRFVRQRIAK